jgi:nucleoside-triphosphatase THEP1
VEEDGALAKTTSSLSICDQTNEKGLTIQLAGFLTGSMRFGRKVERVGFEDPV